MMLEEFIKANKSIEKPQTGIKVIDKLDVAVINLIDSLECGIAENNSVPMQTVDAIVKLAKIRHKFMFDDLKEIERQIARELVKEMMNIAEEKGVFDE